MPSSLSVEVTLNATFTAMVTGVGSDSFTYEWRHNGAIISGETGDTLMITNVMESDRGEYECIVTNQFGDTDTSSVVVLIASELTIMWYYCMWEIFGVADLANCELFANILPAKMLYTVKCMLNTALFSLYNRFSLGLQRIPMLCCSSVVQCYMCHQC